MLLLQLLSHDSLVIPGLQPARLLCAWDFPDKNTVVGCHFFVQGIFLTQGSNLCLLSWQDFFFFLTIEPPGKPQQVKFSDFYSLCFESWIITDIQRRVWLHCASITITQYYSFVLNGECFSLQTVKQSRSLWSFPPSPLPAFCLWWKTLVKE